MLLVGLAAVDRGANVHVSLPAPGVAFRAA
jgi:hypothetical protein